MTEQANAGHSDYRQKSCASTEALSLLSHLRVDGPPFLKLGHSQGQSS